MLPQKRLTEEEALKKIKHYCAWQERCHSEVKDKLYSFGLRTNAVDIILSNLIEDNYLNEERFAITYAGGKFRMKNWGRKKIQYELQQKGVNKANIKIALKELDEHEYLKTLKKLAGKKWLLLAGEHYLTRQAKITSYLLQKGYEHTLISNIVSELAAESKKL